MALLSSNKDIVDCRLFCNTFIWLIQISLLLQAEDRIMQNKITNNYGSIIQENLNLVDQHIKNIISVHVSDPAAKDSLFREIKKAIDSNYTILQERIDSITKLIIFQRNDLYYQTFLLKNVSIEQRIRSITSSDNIDQFNLQLSFFLHDYSQDSISLNKGMEQIFQFISMRNHSRKEWRQAFCSKFKKWFTGFNFALLSSADSSAKYFFTGLVLDSIDFSGAILDGFSFNGSSFEGSQFSKATSVHGSNFSNVDLSQNRSFDSVSGLNAIVFNGRTIVSEDNPERSRIMAKSIASNRYYNQEFFAPGGGLFFNNGIKGGLFHWRLSGNSGFKLGNDIVFITMSSLRKPIVNARLEDMEFNLPSIDTLIQYSFGNFMFGIDYPFNNYFIPGIKIGLLLRQATFASNPADTSVGNDMGATLTLNESVNILLSSSHEICLQSEFNYTYSINGLDEMTAAVGFDAKLFLVKFRFDYFPSINQPVFAIDFCLKFKANAPTINYNNYPR